MSAWTRQGTRQQEHKQTYAATVYRHGTGFPYTQTCGPTGTRCALTRNGAQGDMHMHRTWVTDMGHKGPTSHGGTHMGPRPPGWSLLVLFGKQEPHEVCIADLPVLLHLPVSEGGQGPHVGVGSQLVEWPRPPMSGITVHTLPATAPCGQAHIPATSGPAATPKPMDVTTLVM